MAIVSYPGTYISPGRISRRDFFLFSQIFYKDELGPIKICFIVGRDCTGGQSGWIFACYQVDETGGWAT
jgi:hypothetical protein